MTEARLFGMAENDEHVLSCNVAFSTKTAQNQQNQIRHPIREPIYFNYIIPGVFVGKADMICCNCCGKTCVNNPTTSTGNLCVDNFGQFIQVAAVGS
jgi:hypothetical protein